MRYLFSLLFLILSISGFSQQSIYTDNDGDGIIEYKLIDKKGNSVETGFYYNGKMVGTWTSYFPNGKKQYIARFKNGAKHGKWLTFDTSGRVLYEIYYNEGLRVSATQHQYSSN